MNYKIGIFGAGAIVESSHIPVLKVLPGVTVEWVYDLNSSRTAMMSEMFGTNALAGKGIAAAIEDVDICLLTIPYGARKEYISLCASNEKALYVEKPFAVNEAEHKSVCSMFPAYKLAVGFQRRYYHIVEQLKYLVASGVFGALTNIEIVQGYFSLKGSKEFLTNAALAGGGVIIESAIHTFDQVLQITGATSLRVDALQTLQVKGIDYDTTFSTTLFVEGAQVNVTAAISTLRNFSNGLTFHFENAIVKCGTSPDSQIKVYSKSGKPMMFHIELSDWPGTARANSVSAAFYQFWSDFIQSVDSREANQTAAVNSLLTSVWMEQVYAKIN
ncbi:MAG TPA: Gfo/Idh/MocA family oxidoreductase [Chitinophagaceae bacterium]|nr:Gfo/Idh/MocA family oxidoreductase [Chitinophagaceae bacterium]